ncbi:MAG TPA: maleylpyruvate isomerase N-terminal domain-containing protein [Frankiaceae bacterium]|jgi:uncharacterized protein (TIGR03083 family)|nr:maleylpyruvate isomerase N-terminal domain-containing protein [Frankiaceae bacterium]
MAASHHEYLKAIRAQGETLLAHVGAAPDAAVPSCPGWDNLTLVRHIGRIWHYASRQARTTEPLDASGAPEDGEDSLVWAADGLTALLLTLTETGPEAPAWNWARSEPDTAAFWYRRMAQETAVHCWDADSATGDPAPVTAWLAADGIDEVMTMWLPRRRGQAKEDITGTVHLHAADPSEGHPSEWFVELGPRGKVTCRYAHEKGDAVLRGASSDILLRLWKRPSGVEEFGDETVRGALHAE